VDKEKQAAAPPVIPMERITRAILLIRGQKVMLDSDLAQLYEVETKTLNRAVKRNIARFPGDFMLQLQGRGRTFKVPNWHLKNRARTTQENSPLRLHPSSLR